MSPRRTQGSQHFHSPFNKLAELETRATVGSLQVVSRDKKSVEEPSNQNTKSVATDGNVEKKLIEDGRGRDAFASARQEGTS